MFFELSVPELKANAYELKEQLSSTSNWRLLKRVNIKMRLVQVLDEIDYQEGRKQFANRPFSFPTYRKSKEGCGSFSCRCGCWAEIRKKQFGL